MRLLVISAALLTMLGAAQQDGESRSIRKMVYFLKDDAGRRWCGYSSESQFKGEIQSLKAMVVGGAEYTNDQIVAVHMTESDETGDWTVNDLYTVGQNQKLLRLRRTINILPEDNSEEQVFLLAGGKAIRQSSTHREIRTGKATRVVVKWFEAPPVVTSLGSFPFVGLISDRRQQVWATGTLCIPDVSK